MTSLNTMCKTHIPFVPAISIVEDMRYTFCEECENNIESWYLADEPVDELAKTLDELISKGEYK